MRFARFHIALVGLLALPLTARQQTQQQPPGPAAQEAAQPPNFLIVLVDDLGWADLGSGVTGLPGCADHRTPRIAAFSGESLGFTHCYSAAPNCAPSRASLQTGRYTPRHGILTVGSAERGKAARRDLVPPISITVLPAAEETIAERLKERGYTSAHLGKWHLGDDPKTQGYDVNVGGTKAGHPKSYFSPYKNPALTDGPEGEYLTTRLTDEAIGLFDQLEAPFLMHLAYYSVHTPLQAPKERVRERREAGAAHPKYAAMVEALDAEFGRLLDALEVKGLAENTVVIFTSDNGGYGPVTNKSELRGFKGTLDEGGLRVPFFVRLPGQIEPGTSDMPLHHVDVFPTLAAFAGAAPDFFSGDGFDLSAHWRGAKAPDRSMIGWHFPVYLEGKSDRFEHWRTTPGGACLVEGRWKIIEYFDGSPEGATSTLELYDIQDDPKEQRDLATSNPEQLAKCVKMLRMWQAWTEAEMPKAKAK